MELCCTGNIYEAKNHGVGCDFLKSDGRVTGFVVVLNTKHGYVNETIYRIENVNNRVACPVEDCERHFERVGSTRPCTPGTAIVAEGRSRCRGGAKRACFSSSCAARPSCTAGVWLEDWQPCSAG